VNAAAPGRAGASRALPRPDFYLPWPARENPARETARARARTWARGIGMLDEGIWDEARFDAIDLAGAGAYCFPEAPDPLLALLVEWGDWAFYFDDAFLERFKRGGDAAGAREYVERSAALLGADPPAPLDAAQRALADLWSRTAPLMSERWQARFARHTAEQMRESLWELANLGADRLPNPVEYLRRRRGTAGGDWSAELVELAAAVELPPVLVGTRPLRVLRDCFGDAALLDNDLFSYRRETEEENEVNNGVLVLEHFLGLTPPPAAEVVNRLLTSRMQQFENTLLTELPLLFEEHAVDPVDRLRVLGYAKGLQDFRAGIHQWMEESSRYAGAFLDSDAAWAADAAAPARLPFPGPRGLGTAAARLCEVYRPVLPTARTEVSPVPVSVSGFEFDDVYPAYSSPYVDSVRPEVVDWALRMGMLDGIVWTERDFERIDIPGWAGATHPEAGRETLMRIAKWYAWRAYVDAVLERWFTPRRDYLGAKAYLSRIAAFLPGDGVSMPPPANVVERALADLWPATFAAFTPLLRCAFPGHVRQFADGRLWELANRAQGRVPDSVDYLEMRRHTAGQGFATDLVRHATGTDVTGLEDAETAFADIAAWRADIAAYPADVEAEGSVNNGVLVLERLLGASPQQAMDIARDLVLARMHELEDAGDDGADGRYLDGLRAWLGGSFAHIHEEVAR
jgi:germacradienol/geosmin synthase